jgi:glycosyltransferase involved in cell wall biosynthesis
VPVVTTEVGNVVEMLQDVPNAHVSPSFEPKALAELVQKVIMADIDRQAIRDGFLAKGLSQEAIAQKLISLYQETILRKRKNGK